MLRAYSVQLRGTWHESPSDSIVLDFEDRHRRRLAMTSVHGLAFLLDLAEARVLRNGDALLLETGDLVEIVAAPEPLTEIVCADARMLLRIVWHLGNRHMPVEIGARRLRIRRDHVIEAMVQGLGGKLLAIEAPFDPEGGAYGETHRHDAGAPEHAHAGMHTHVGHGHA